jgi:DNA-binding GntR family transcriptional regulator
VSSVALKQTRTDEVYTRVRADILGGRLPPGTRLKFSDLAEQFDASIGVIRESLIRLAEQGLVRSEAHQGFVVTPLSRDDLAELTEARVAIEGLVLRSAIADGDLAWEARLLAAHHILDRTPSVDPEDPLRLSEAWATAHQEFHQALLGGCANRRLCLIAAGLRDEAELYRRWSLPLGDEPDRDVAGEHRAMLQAALARDVEAAAAALREHIEHTTRSLLSRTSDSATSAVLTY